MSREPAEDMAIEIATVDRDGRLIAADPMLAALNARAGGAAGLPIALPQVAAAVVLARRLGVRLDRSALVADEGGASLLRLVLEPDGDGTRITVTGWKDAATRDVPRLAGAVADTRDGPAGASSAVGFLRGLDGALRAPLARIVANADSIVAKSEGPIAEEYAGYAADIASAGRHLIGLVGDLADLETVEGETIPLLIEPIDLADVARRAAGLLGVRAAEARVTIGVPARGVVVLGDFRRCLQILVNLMSNALRYAPAGSTIAVSVGDMGSHREVAVADGGKGISDFDQARIFDKFVRADPDEAGGSGLGLYIARRFARAMDGDITVESAPGEGARFALALPAA